MKYFIGCIALICFSFGQNVLGCTLMSKSLSRFDDSEYIFIGKVVGYTAPVEFDEKRANNSVEPISSTNMGHPEKNPAEAVGLKVNVVESVYLPKAPVDYFEIFTFDLMADCSIGGESIDKIKRHFPIDTEVRVIAKVAEFVPRVAGDRIIRLEVRPSEPNEIITNIDKKGLRMTSSHSIFSYKDYRYDMNSDSDSKYLLPAFEIRKDLLRLKTSKTQVERNSILDRLLHVPSNADLELKGLFDTYAASQAEADSFYESQLESSSPETYKQYKVFKQSLDELIKRGFDKKLAEEAIGKALSEGTDIEPTTLIKRAAEILVANRNRPSPKHIL